MFRLIIAFSITQMLLTASLAIVGKLHAQTLQECAGENCPKSSGQSGHGCKSKANTVR